MGREIERKFLVKGNEWRSQGVGMIYRQGYISTKESKTVRIRIVGDQGYITIKGPIQGYTRLEFEYPIPLQDAQMLLETLCDRPLIEKTRYRWQKDNLVWEIDEFRGENAGLIIAEVELESEETKIEIPEWIGQEVSHDHRYHNSNLVKNPYCNWSKSIK